MAKPDTDFALNGVPKKEGDQSAADKEEEGLSKNHALAAEPTKS